MKLLRFSTNGFGALRGEFRFDPDRVTLLVDDNERGKSTLLSAITAALYGLDGDRRSHRVLTPLERWKPWDDGPYRVELELEADGERYTVTRDFDNGTVSVWTGRGQDVTADFRDGKDEYPVGLKLLGLDAEEFERCAMVRQGDLLEVIPSDERERRSPSLRAKLEAVADSRVGDARASEALKVLEGALRRYNCLELDFTGTVENAIQRLEGKQHLLEAELQELAHALEQNAGPLEELADIGEAEREAREALAGLDAEWRGVLAADARRQLGEDRAARDEVEKLQLEYGRLSELPDLAADAESQFRDAVARLEEAQRNVIALEGRRQGEVSRERAELESERASLKAFDAGGAAEADRCVTLASELRRSVEEESRLRDEIFNLRESLATEGHDPERLQWLTHRLGRLSEGDHQLLRRQSELALAHHTEAAELEGQRTASSEALRDIDAQRGRRTLPGWFLLALGISILVAGIVVVALQGLPWLSNSFFVSGALLLGGGVVMVQVGQRLRAEEREEALVMLAEAQRRLNELRTQRAETETALETLARERGYRDHVELLREWNELMRLREESSPTSQAQGQLAQLEGRRLTAIEEARELLGRFGIRTVDPANLDKVAGLLRQLETVRQKLTALDRNWSWIDEQKRVDEGAASGFKQRAVRILESAGLDYDAARSWEEHARALSERAEIRRRWSTLTHELIPSAQRRCLPEAQRAELESQVALGEGTVTEGARRGQRELDAERRRLQERLEDTQRRRSDLRVKVEEVCRRVHAERPEKLAHLERIQRALQRARRFQSAVDLACRTIKEVAAETHQRWADHLNRRVGELLAAVGTSIDQIRFGDDLDFSVRTATGLTLARGKADQQLSAGTRDQLYLAVRLAVSEFLSRGQTTLPILLDDVFVTSDDERTRAGMRLLIESFAAQHQVILMTCHRRRFEALAEQERALYQGRVQWLDTRSAGLAGSPRAER
jgi:hypothetical protein